MVFVLLKPSRQRVDLLFCCLFCSRLIEGDFDTSLQLLGVKEQQESLQLRRVTTDDFVHMNFLGVSVNVGCVILVRTGNATLEIRTKKGHIGWLDLPNAKKTTLENEFSKIKVPLMCRLRYAKRRYQKVTNKELAFITSVSDPSYLWKYWRWMLNKLCYCNSHDYAYYLFIGAPHRNQPRQSAECPAKIEESLAHTTKALSLFAALALKIAPRFIFLDADIWYTSLDSQQNNIWPQWIQATKNAHLALPAPCYRQFFGAAIVAVRASDWAMGFLAKWFHLRCGPKDQPSLWHLVLSTAGELSIAHNVLSNYHDIRCLNESTGELTKSDCRDCAPKQCGYYAAWKLANDAFFYLWNEKRDISAVIDNSEIFAVSKPIFTPGNKVAYLPNQGPLSLLCGNNSLEPPLRHIKWLRKSQRDLPLHLCGALPPNLYFKGPRDADF